LCLLDCGRGRIQLAVALLDTSGTDVALYRDADMVRAIVRARRVKFLPGLTSGIRGMSDKSFPAAARLQWEVISETP
jgi:hypothetical protein